MRSPARATSCTRQKGICLTVMAIPLFISVYLLIFLNLDFINSKQSNSNKEDQQSRLHAQSLVRMQRAIDDLHLDLSQVTDHRDSLLHHIVSISRNISHSNNIQEIKDALPSINRIEKYQTYILQSIIRYKPYMLTCDQLTAIQVMGNVPSLSSQYSNMFHGLYGMDQVFLVKPKIDLCVTSHREYNENCVVSVNYQVTQDILLLQQIRHPNVVKLLGYCSRDDELLYVTEAGRIVDLKNVTQSDWFTKLKVAHSIATVFFSLSQSAGGFLSLNISDSTTSSAGFPSSLFVQTTAGHIKLASAAAVVHRDPSCKTDSDCHIRWFKGIKCRESQCGGYNAKKAHLDLIQYYLEPILENSPEYIRAQVKFARQKVWDMPHTEIINLLGKWKEIEENRLRSGSTARLKKDREKKLREMIGLEGRVLEMSDIDSWPAGPGDAYKYQKIEKTDMPGENDYACPRSQYPWGCVHALQTLHEAFMRCNGDPQCRAMVMYPSKIKPGWLEVVFKGGTEGRVSGDSVLYIKQLVSNATVAYFKENLKNNHDNNPGPAGIEVPGAGGNIPASMLQPCLDDMFHMQQVVRSEREKTLMGLFGLRGVTEDQWRILVTKAFVTGSSSVNSPSVQGGQAVLYLDNHITNKVTFAHTDGTANNYLAHLAMHQLDRILGFYMTVPTAYRTLTELEVRKLKQNDPFFKNQFSSVLVDNTLDGILMLSAIGSPLPLTLPKFANYTDSVIPILAHQRKQLEYLLLLWLSGTPRPLSQITSVGGTPLHLSSTDAFQQGVDDLLPYFYNCQFPRHTVEILWSLQDEATDYCTLASQLLYELQTDHVTPQRINKHFKSPHIIATLVNRAADTLTHIIDTCIDKFSEAKVLYV